MQVVQASQELAQVVQAMIVAGMAHALIRRAVNLHDDLSVIVALAQSGFGASSIRALRRRATATARQIKAASMKVH